MDFYTWDDKVHGDPEDFEWELIDPCHVPELEALLAEPQRPALSESLHQKRNELSIPSMVVTNDDDFTKLPQEVCDRIACFLSMPEVFDLRLASRAFAYTFYNQQFWASRFNRPNSERGWLFEARDQTQHRDWRYTHYSVQYACFRRLFTKRA